MERMIFMNGLKNHAVIKTIVVSCLCCICIGCVSVKADRVKSSEVWVDHVLDDKYLCIDVWLQSYGEIFSLFEKVDKESHRPYLIYIMKYYPEMENPELSNEDIMKFDGGRAFFWNVNINSTIYYEEQRAKTGTDIDKSPPIHIYYVLIVDPQNQDGRLIVYESPSYSYAEIYDPNIDVPFLRDNRTRTMPLGVPMEDGKYAILFNGYHSDMLVIDINGDSVTSRVVVRKKITKTANRNSDIGGIRWYEEDQQWSIHQW